MKKNIITKIAICLEILKAIKVGCKNINLELYDGGFKVHGK